MHLDERNEGDYRIHAGALESPHGGYLAAVVVNRIGCSIDGPREADRDTSMTIDMRYFFTAGMATSVSAILAGTGVDHGSHASGSARAESAMSMAMRAAACCSSGRGASKGLGRAGPMHSMQAAHSAIGPQCESSYHCAAREVRANSKLE